MLKSEPVSTKKTLLYIAIAFLFGILIRLITLEYLLPQDVLWHPDGTPVSVLTPDTGYYGYYARQILDGHFYPIDQADRMPGYLIALFTWLFSANIDWVIFILPIFIASLVVVPTVMIGNLFKRPTFGFVAALFLVADLNYFGRSYVSCLDTDILNLFFPMMTIYYMMKLGKTNTLIPALGGALFLWLFALWYHSYAPIALGLLIGYLVTVFFFFRNSVLHYQAFFILAVAIAPVHPLYSALLVLCIFLFFSILNFRVSTSAKPYILFFAAALPALLLFADMSHYYSRALVYFDRPEMNVLNTETGQYYFYNQLSSVAEAVSVNIIEPAGFFNRQSSLILLSTIGYLLMLLRYRSMFYFLPLLVLGYGSYFFGNRFMMYATPALSFGLSYLLLILFDGWQRHSHFKHISKLRNILIVIILFFMVDIIHTFSKFHSQVFRAEEISAIRQFSKQIDENDMLITWWDYGWPLWYYTGYDNTMTDNGYHGKYDSYAVSRILLSDSQEFTANAAAYFSAMQKKAKENKIRFALEYLAKKGVDLNKTFVDLETGNIPHYKEYGDVYILLHSEILGKMESINRSSNFDFATGKYYRAKTIKNDKLKQPYMANTPSVMNGELFTLDAVNGTIATSSNKSYAIRRIGESKEHKFYAQKSFGTNAPVSVLIAKSVYALYLDNSIYDSFFVQAYFFDNYDKDRFEKVVETPYMKIFKVLPVRKD